MARGGGVVRLIALMDNRSAIRGFKEIGAQSDRTARKIKRDNRESASSMAGLGTSSKRLGGAFSGLAGVVGLGGLAFGLKDAITGAVDFQSEMERLRTTVGVSQGEVNSMSKSVLGLAPAVATGPKQLAEGLYHIEAQGLRSSTALKALHVAADGAAIGHANLEDVTNALGATLVSGIVHTQDYGSVMGELNTIVGTGDMRMQDLAEALGTGLLTQMRTAGVSLRDTGAALAVFGDNNIRGADAATKLRQAILGMTAPSGAAQKTLAKLGMTPLEMANNIRQHGLIYALTDLQKHLDRLTSDPSKQAYALSEIFGRRAQTGVLALLKELPRLQRKYDDLGKGAKGYAGQVAAYHHTMAYQLNSAKVAVEALVTTIGIGLMPVVSRLVHAFSGFVAVLVKHRTIIFTIIKLLAIMGAAWLAVKTIMLGVAGVAWLIEKVGIAIKFVTTWTDLETLSLKAMYIWEGITTAATGALAFAQGALATATGFVTGAFDLLMANPIILFLVALGVVVYEVVTHFGFFKKIAVDAFHWVTNAASNTWNWIKGHWIYLVGILTGPFGFAIAYVVTHFKQVVSTVQGVVRDIGHFFGNVFHMLIAPIEKAIEWVKSHAQLLNPFHWLKKGLGLVGGLLGGAGHAISSLFHHTGGPVPRRYAQGGPVYMAGGGPMGSDTVPAWLTPGEYVLNSAVANRVGMPFLHALNTGQIGGEGERITIVPGPVRIQLDSRTIANAVVQFTLQRGAFGPSTMAGGALSTGVASVGSTL